MDGVAYAIFGYNYHLAEIEIAKSAKHVWQKDSSSKKSTVDSELINFLIKRFYREC